MKNNYYCYQINDKEKISGFFRIYQAKDGGIYLMMNNVFIRLSKEQIDELGIDVYSLEDFDFVNFKIAYKKHFEPNIIAEHKIMMRGK